MVKRGNKTGQFYLGMVRNKTGQFYLVAAIIIIMILVGIAGTKVYATSEPEPRNIKDISFELKQEGPMIIDYGIYKGENTKELLNNFTEIYAPYFLQKTENSEIIFIYGNETSLSSVMYNQTEVGKISASVGSGIDWDMWKKHSNDIILKDTPGVSGGDIEITLGDKDYKFNIKEGEMFYFLIVHKKDNEVYIEKNG